MTNKDIAFLYLEKWVTDPLSGKGNVTLGAARDALIAILDAKDAKFKEIAIHGSTFWQRVGLS